MKNILLVEDETILAMNEKTQLEKYDYSVEIANSGEKAIDIVRTSQNIDLILMDINLGRGIDGTEAAKMILEDFDIPIVFLSSHAESEIVEKTEKITSYGYVVKSSSITVLDTSIKMAFRLFDAKKQIEEVFDGSINGICIHKMLYNDNREPYDCEYIRVNKSFHRHTGLKQDLEGLTIRDLYPDGEADDVVKMYAEMLETKKPLKKEFYFESTKKWFELSGFLNGNSLDEFTIMVQDITSRKQAEEEYKSIVQTSIDGFWIVDKYGKIIDINDSYSNIIGYTKEELLQMSIQDIEVNENEDEVRRHLSDLIQRGWDRFETKHSCKNGSLIDVEVSATYSRDNEHIYVFIRDITEQKNLEEVLKNNEEKFKELFEHAPFGYQSLDEEGRFIEVNQIWTETLGYSKEEILGKWFGDFLDSEYVQVFKERFPKFKETGEVHTEFYMIHKSGEKVLVKFDGRVGYNTDGSFKQTHCVLRGKNYE